MPDASFDIVIAGTDLAGLAYGALCAKQGYTVLVLGQDARPATYAAGEATLYRSSPLFYGFGTSAAIHDFFRDLSLLPEMRNRPARLEPSLQVITPGVRFNFPERPDGLESELNRVFGSPGNELVNFLRTATRDAKELDLFLEELPPLPADGFFARYRLKRYIARHEGYLDSLQPLLLPSDLRFTGPLTSALLLLARLHSRPVTPFLLRRLCQHLLGGFFEYPQGIDGMKRLFTERITGNGGAYWPERAVELISLKGRKVVDSVLVQRPRRQVGVRMLVGNCPPRQFFSLVPQEQQNAQFHAQVKALQPAAYNYVVNFVVKPDLIPESMARNVLLSLAPRQTSTGPGVLWLYIGKPDPAAENGPATILATTRIEPQDLPLDGASFKQLNERILCSLEWALPFIREKLIQIHTPYATLDRDRGEERLDPGELQEVFADPFPGCLELSALPCQAWYKNIVMLGDHYLGGLGLEGAFMAAQQAFKLTCDRIVLKKILRK